MAYHVYTTKGLVLSERSLREADRVYSILTRDFGLIRATALGVRKITSKLRGSLEPVCLVRVSLVKGKEYWRVTSVEFLGRVEQCEEVMRPLALLEQLVVGEAPHPELYDAVEKELSSPQSRDEESEVKLVATILFHLGYLKEEDLALEQATLVKAINKGLQESGLTD